MRIEGQPEGVEIVRIGIAGPDEFELIDGYVVKGPRKDSTSQVIVRPSPGWGFRFDVRTLGLRPMKLLPSPTEITYAIKFKVETEEEVAGLDTYMRGKFGEGSPLFVEMTKS